MTLNLDEELNSRVLNAARSEGMSKTEYIRQSIIAKLEADEASEADGDLERIEAAWTVAGEEGRAWLAKAADMVRRVC